MNQACKQLLTLAFALVFMAGTAFAQSGNNSFIEQVGQGHKADVTQTGPGNLSEITQNIGNNGPAAPNYDGHATIDQTGENNKSKLTQITFYGGHDATITQVGDDNYSEIVTSNGGGKADVWMYGDNNHLLSYRLDRNFSYHTQKNDNRFTLNIGTPSTGSNNNRVGMSQEFGIGEVKIMGSDNRVLLRQHAGANYDKLRYDRATITVDGSDNRIDVDQKKDGINNRATVELLNGSDNNMVEIDQFDSNHTSMVTVDGMDNQAIVRQQN
jgi:hypothetical protein